MAQMGSHISVLLNESVDYLLGEYNHQIKQQNNSVNKFKQPTSSLEIPQRDDNLHVFIDATFGAGGHSRRILEKQENSKIIAIDRDPSVACFVEELKRDFPDRIIFVNDKFSNMGKILANNSVNLAEIGGIIYDLGFSSMQIDSPERGFSFKYNTQLDMSMGSGSLSAVELLNTGDENLLADILFNYSDERNSRRISKKIVEYRQKQKIQYTEQLVEIVCSVNGQPRYGKIHPATRTFQAIRMYVNSEVEELIASVLSAILLLPRGASITVITFHSVEDLIVKTLFKIFSGQQVFLENIPQFIASAIDQGLAMINFQQDWKNQQKNTINPRLLPVNKKPITPSKSELQNNQRAESAKLRSAMVF